MRTIKDTEQAAVCVGFDGRVQKFYRGPSAKERYINEVKVLRYLEERHCPFVPRVINTDPNELSIVISNCGSQVEYVREERLQMLFDELETYGVHHDDPFERNVTYEPHSGRFFLIDFEFATILETGEGFKLDDITRSCEHNPEVRKRLIA